MLYHAPHADAYAPTLFSEPVESSEKMLTPHSWLASPTEFESVSTTFLVDTHSWG